MHFVHLNISLPYKHNFHVQTCCRAEVYSSQGVPQWARQTYNERRQIEVILTLFVSEGLREETDTLKHEEIHMTNRKRLTRFVCVWDCVKDVLAVNAFAGENMQTHLDLL